MKIYGMLVCGKGEARRYLKKTLTKLSELCDRIFIWGDGCEKETIDLCLSFSKVRFFLSESLWQKGYQPYIKENLLSIIYKENPDWIVCCDADEEFDETFTRKEVEYYAKLEGIAYYFLIINLWDSEKTFRKDGGWLFWNVRMFKVRKDLPINYLKTPVHCGLAPRWAYEYGVQIPHLVKHYGYLKKEDRQKKTKRYKKLDSKQQFQSPSWYESFFAEPSLEFFEERKVLERLKKNISIDRISSEINEKIVKKKIMRYYLIRNTQTGLLFEAPEKILNDIKRQPNIEILGEISEVRKKKELPVKEVKKDFEKIQEKFKEELKCPICGKVCENRAGLKAHLRLVHNITKSSEQKNEKIENSNV